MAYKAQSVSLQYVQKYGPELERAVTRALGWSGGRLEYFRTPNSRTSYDLQVDAYWPEARNPRAFVSVTYTRPDKPGHSNENKLQLKLGELMLLKGRYPDIRSILVVGGNEKTWLPYVLQAFDFFFDETVFAWRESFDDEIATVGQKPNEIALKHVDAWTTVAREWSTRKLWTDAPIRSALRRSMWEQVSETGREGDLPEQITNPIFRHCMQAAFETHKSSRGRNGKEWNSYMEEDWDSLWQSRSYFNPAEAAIELCLRAGNFAYEGGLAKDVEVPSVIHHLGGEHVDNTKVGEDFVLYSKKLNQPVLIQSKSTGGGKEDHGKNIQNRTKEQLARSLFYRGAITSSGSVVLRPKDFFWITVLDGDWGVTRKTPLKYIHMLQWAGYDVLIPADSLVDEDLIPLRAANNPLIKNLSELDCLTDVETFKREWGRWRSARKKG